MFIMQVILAGISAAILLLCNVSFDNVITTMSASANLTAETVQSMLPANLESIRIYLIIGAAVLVLWYIAFVWLMIFKELSYSMSGMALAERPQMGVRKALRASRRITRRNHWKLFVVDLSFIGWYLLAYLAICVVGGIGVALNFLNLGQLGLIITLGLFIITVILVMYLLMPYRVGVHAKCYTVLKRIALNEGIVEKSDFHGKREVQDYE